MLTYRESGYASYLRISSIVIASILFIACAAESFEIVNITDTGVTESQIVQTKIFDQCESASVLKAEVQFSKSNEQESSKELVINGGIEGEVAIPFTAKAQLEGGVETHLKSLNKETIGHQESALIEIPAHAQQEYAITWREIYRQGEISYVEDGQTKVATFSARIGVELVKTTVRDLGCPEKVASSQLSTPIPTYTPAPVIDTATATQTPLPAINTPSATFTPVPPINTSTPTSVPATRTPTRKPSTATSTRTKTPVPPTRTPTRNPPTATFTRTPTPEFSFFDDFQHGSTYDSRMWRSWDNVYLSGVSQENGMLRLQSDQDVQLLAIEHSEIQLTKPFFLEAKVRIGEDADNDSLNIKIYSDLATGGWWNSLCRIYGESISHSAWVICENKFEEKPSSLSPKQLVDFDSWHILRIEFVPAFGTLTYYVDGQKNGVFTVSGLDGSRFSFVIEGYTSGYFDYVKYGLLK